MFLKLKNTVDAILTPVNTDKVATHISSVYTLMAIWITFLIMYHGYMTLAGKSEAPAKDIMWKIVSYLVILAFAFNSGGLITLVNNAIESLIAWAGNGTTSDALFIKLDKMYELEKSIGVKMESFDGPLEFQGLVSQMIVSGGFFLVSMMATIIVLLTTFTLKILMMITPLMIVTNLFGWVKPIFGKWVELIINNVLVVLFVSIFLNVLNDKYKKALELADSKLIEANVFNTASDLLIVSILVFFMILLAKGIATQLTYVSIESLPGGAVAQVGSGTQKAGRAAKSAGRAGARTINGVSNVSTAVGNRFTKK